MGKKYSNNIVTGAGFNYHATQPLDDRDVVEVYEDLAALVADNNAYEGMEVYVINDKQSYQLIGTEWKARRAGAGLPDGDGEILILEPTRYSEGLEYSLKEDGTYELVNLGTCEDTNIVIPASYNNLPVTSIGDAAFDGCTSLTSVTIPDSVTSIGSWAFLDCRSLTSIDIPDSVTSIGYRAFCWCNSLASITIPDSVTSIGEEAFNECTSLTSIDCKFTRGSVAGAPWGAKNATITYALPEYSEGLSYSLKDDNTYEVTGIGTCTDLDIVIPKTYNNLLVTSIGTEAFFSCSLTSVTIPDSVTSIGTEAFHYCPNLTSVELGKGATSIGQGAFCDCHNLESITIPDSVTSIGSMAFTNCPSLTNIMIPNNVTSIGSSAFAGCSSLESITLPFIGYGTSASTYFGYIFGALNYTSQNSALPVSLKTVTITSGTSIDDYAFYGCSNLTSIVIPDSVTSIGASAFYNCDSLTSVEIPDSVTSIGKKAFLGCDSLTSVVIPKGVTSIRQEAFASCTSLTSVTIPNSVTSIGSEIFYNGAIVLTVYCEAKSKPDGWDDTWNYSTGTVHTIWGAILDLDILSINDKLDSIYPVGSIYMSTINRSPAEGFGGVWERLKDSFLLGAGDTYAAGATGGSATHSHTPDLWAEIYLQKDDADVRSQGILMMQPKQMPQWKRMSYIMQDNKTLSRKNTTSDFSYQYGTNVDGTIKKSSSLPPYLAVYMWKRIA